MFSLAIIALLGGRQLTFFNIINNHIVGLVHKNHSKRTRLMYHAACTVEFQPFKRLYSQLTFFTFFQILTADVFQLFMKK